ncbi:MAG TPA: thioredoxin [Clostridia bacterium]|nr:thioredoxin [Clostridia bacterium]
MSNVVVVTNDTFQKEVLESELPVLVDFWAAWCGPCKMIAPVIDEIAEELKGEVKVCKLNVDENGETAQKYGIMSIPTLLLFKDGVLKAQQIGFQPKDALLKFIRSNI